MVVDISLSKSSISHISLYSPEGSEIHFQLTLLRFHQLPFSCPSPASMPQYKCNHFYSFVIVKGIQNSHGHQHSNILNNYQRSIPSLIFPEVNNNFIKILCVYLCVTFLVICHLDKMLSAAFIQMDCGRELLTVLCNEKLYVYKMLHVQSQDFLSFKS